MPTINNALKKVWERIGLGAASAAAIASIISMLGGFNGGLTSAHPVVALPEGRSVTLDDAFAGREGSRPDGGSIEDRSALEECHRSRQAYSAVLAVDPPRTADFRACFGADVGQESLSGIEFVRRVADSGTSGADVELTDVAITGDVDLRPIRNVERPIRCTRCVFQGHVLARDVRFGGIMEFIDARFERRVDLRGAFFDQAAIFDGSEFLESIELSSARFGALSSFAEVRFADTALFDRTVFAGRAVFASSDPVVDRPNERCGSEQPAFVMRASFVGASFGDAADFRQRCFEQSAIFQSASFAAAADFTLTTFFGTASFDQVGLAEGGEFVVADFQRDLSFAGTATAGVLDFAGSTIRARSDFTGLGGSGALRLEGIKTPSNDVFVMNDVTVTSLAMDPDRVAQVGGPAVRVEILELIVATAQTEGRLGLANDAQFELMSIRGTNKRGSLRAADWLFYQTIAGYLVRPLHPIFTLLVLLNAGAWVRVIRGGRARRDAPRTHGRSGASTRFVGDIFSGYAMAVKRAWSSSSGASVPDKTSDPVPPSAYLMELVRFAEWLSYRTLIVIALIGFANAVPVVRELIETVF